MAFLSTIQRELTQEAAVTRWHLVRVPFDQQAFKLHYKSESLGRLAIHVTEIVAWWKECLENSGLDFINFDPQNIQPTDELLAHFGAWLSVSEEALVAVKEEELEKEWSMRYGERILLTLSKKEGLRKICMNHLFPHRAQLGVYLRSLDTPVLAAFRPSADNEEVTLINPFL